MPETVVTFAKALADSTRVRILGALRAGELCVCELVDVLAVPQSTLSTHLQVLRRAGLVHVRRRHKWAYYRLSVGTAGLVEAVFSHFGDDPELTQTLEQDRERLQRRLACRVDGCCVVAAPVLLNLQGGNTDGL
ncbi:MAG: metalloregulator ArsR/SmtB family transcription factor [Armatimonadota bacterium]